MQEYADQAIDYMTQYNQRYIYVSIFAPETAELLFLIDELQNYSKPGQGTSEKQPQNLVHISQLQAQQLKKLE